MMITRVPVAARLGAACLVQLCLLGGVLWPQLSARTAGQEYRLAVEPVDPIDPFRGAYVVLGYPDLPLQPDEQTRPLFGPVFVPLEQRDGLWAGGEPVQARPSDGPYLRCEAEYALRCGIESLFASQADARRLERELADGAVATVRIDDRGNAALMGIEPTG